MACSRTDHPPAARLHAAKPARCAALHVLVAVFALLCAPLLAGVAWAAPAPRTLDRATAVALAVDPDETADWTHARELRLPHEWDAGWPGASGLAAYRLRFDARAEDGELLGLFIERACHTVRVSLNGQLIHQGGRLIEPVTRMCRQPLLLSIPVALLKPADNMLELTVRGFAPGEVESRASAGGLSALWLGAYASLAAGFEQRRVLAVRLPEVASGTLVLMGGFMFLLGWFHRKQSYLAYFGALMIGWALTLSRLWLTDLPWPNRASELLLATLVSFVTLAGVQFLMRYAGVRLRWLDIGLPLQCSVMALSLVIVGPAHLQTAASIWYGVLSFEITAAAAYHLIHARRRHLGQPWLMGVLLALVAAALLAELAAQQWQVDARVAQVAQLVPALVLIILGMRLVQQYGRALQSAERDRAELEVRVREATAQVERNYAQLAEMKVEQVTARERKRIAADLHDDLGAKLLTIVHTSDSERISTLAREALEEMRLSVRGLTGKAVRLSDALGDWRAEVVSRLGQSGIGVEWQAPSDDDVPQTLSARAFVQTTRILREAVSNVIKHSNATHCSIRCTIAAGDFQLLIQDNGAGIPAALDGHLDKGHGMASMKGRAKQLQGQCLVESGPGYGTVIRLTLPLDRHVTPG